MRPTNTMTRVLGFTANILDAAVLNLDNGRRIAKFLRGRAEFEVRPDDVFISSYPRSGTTLTQWIVYLLAQDPREDPAHLTQVSPWFERSLAIGEFTAAELDAMPSPRVFKSHLPRRWLPDGAKYIYVRRNVEDVVVSYFHLYEDYLGFRGSFDQFYERFMRGDVQYGSWFDHVSGWDARAGDRDVLILRYEDLLEDRRANIASIVRFLGWAREPAAVEGVVDESAFAAMKAREHVFDHATALLLERGVQPRSFLRRGKAGQGEEVLSEAQRARLKETRSTGHRLAIRGLAAFLQ